MSNKNTRLGYKGISEILSVGSPHIRFLGIGGVGMYSLARICLARGIRVSGYDRSPGAYTERLRALGVSVSHEPDVMTACTATLAVYSLAVDEYDAELLYLGSLGVPRVSRADFLSYLMGEHPSRIGVAGTHGKSTVSSMIHAIFSRAGRAPTSAIGAELASGEPFEIGGEDTFIYEACEYRDSFLSTEPTVAAITCVEYDHPDYFSDESAVVDSFLKYINSTGSLAVLPADDKNIASVLDKVGVPYVSYGVSSVADYRYALDSFYAGGCRFSIHRGALTEAYSISLLGSHNVANAVCAAVCALESGIESEVIRAALRDFSAPSRRLEYIGEYRGRRVLYDYAHHPTEISAAIGAVSAWRGEKITVIFKPHTYTRTRAFWDGFVRSLSLADYVILTDIYPAREEAIFGISSQRLAEQIGERAEYSADADILSALDKTEGTIIIMGAGELGQIKDTVLGAEKFESP